jgi:hypothetical protein
MVENVHSHQETRRLGPSQCQCIHVNCPVQSRLGAPYAVQLLYYILLSFGLFGIFI